MKFYGSLDSVRANPPSYGDPFITQWEIPEPKDDRSRMYVVFDGIEEYLRYHSRNRYTTCHEVLLRLGNGSDIPGHIAFDIDKKPSDHESIDTLLPPDWEQQLEQAILEILTRQYPQFEEKITSTLSQRGRWVWMTSPSSKKISKHLVISGIVFSAWRAQMKLILSDLKKGVGNLPESILSALDDAIYRKDGSLRLPLNTKKPVKEEYTAEDGTKSIRLYAPRLIFDNPSHTFLDGIIGIHDANMSKIEGAIMLTPSDLAPDYQPQCTYVPPSLQENLTSESIDEENTGLLTESFHTLDKKYSTGLRIGNLSGAYLTLLRSEAGKCPISRKVHESDNAYLFMKGGRVFFGCHRGCTITIGNITKKYIDVTSYPKDPIESTVHTIRTQDLRSTDYFDVD